MFKADGKVPNGGEGNARYEQGRKPGGYRKLANTPAGSVWGVTDAEWETDDFGERYGGNSRHMRQSGRPTERYKGPQGYQGEQKKIPGV